MLDFEKRTSTYVEDEVVFVRGVPYVTMVVNKPNVRLTSKESIFT